MYALGNIIYILWPRKDGGIQENDELYLQAEIIKRELELECPFQILIGISRLSSTLAKIQQLKKQVLHCLEYAKVSDKEQTCIYENLPKVYTQEVYFDITEEITELIQVMQGEQKKQSRQVIRIYSTLTVCLAVR